MACPAEHTVLGFLSGELPAGEVVRVDDHLDACPPCRRLVLWLARNSPSLAMSPTAADLEPAALPPKLSGGIPRGTSVGRYVVLELLGP